MQFNFGKWKPLEINCVPISISIFPLTISSNFFLEDFLLMVSLEKIDILLFGNLSLTSSEILSTPGPLKTKSHNSPFLQSLLNWDWKPH